MISRKPRRQPHSPANIEARARARHIDELLDGALVDTFPASDPVSIDVDAGPYGQPGDGVDPPFRSRKR